MKEPRKPGWGTAIAVILAIVIGIILAIMGLQTMAGDTSAYTGSLSTVAWAGALGATRPTLAGAAS
jgi:hypothetical protein